MDAACAQGFFLWSWLPSSPPSAPPRPRVRSSSSWLLFVLPQHALTLTFGPVLWWSTTALGFLTDLLCVSAYVFVSCAVFVVAWSRQVRSPVLGGVAPSRSPGFGVESPVPHVHVQDLGFDSSLWVVGTFVTSCGLLHFSSMLDFTNQVRPRRRTHRPDGCSRVISLDSPTSCCMAQRDI